jgi:uncharacterized protein with beta-barrel porin domain
MVAWRHAFGDLAPDVSLHFAQSTAFIVAGTPVADEALLVAARARATVAPDATLSLGYSGQFGSGVRDHSVTGGFTFRF